MENEGPNGVHLRDELHNEDFENIPALHLSQVHVENEIEHCASGKKYASYCFYKLATVFFVTVSTDNLIETYPPPSHHEITNVNNECSVPKNVTQIANEDILDAFGEVNFENDRSSQQIIDDVFGEHNLNSLSNSNGIEAGVNVIKDSISSSSSVEEALRALDFVIEGADSPSPDLDGEEDGQMSLEALHELCNIEQGILCEEPEDETGKCNNHKYIKLILITT